MESIVYELTRPITTHKGEVNTLTINPPKAKSFLHGMPYTEKVYATKTGQYALHAALNPNVCFKFLADMTGIDEIDIIDISGEDVFPLFRIVKAFTTKEQPEKTFKRSKPLDPITYTLSRPIKTQNGEVSTITIQSPRGRTFLQGLPYYRDETEEDDGSRSFEIAYDSVVCIEFLKDMTGLSESEILDLPGEDVIPIFGLIVQFTTGSPLNAKT